MTPNHVHEGDESMTIRFRRVLGIRSRGPVVLATVDGYLVRWQPRTDWTCECDEDTFPACPHIPAVRSLLDQQVFTSEDGTVL